MRILSNDKLSFGPFKPIVLRGSPEEDASYVFSSYAVLSLSKPEKVSSITVTMTCASFVYFPEGIGARAAKTTFDKTLNRQTLTLLKKDIELQAGIHRFPFTFIVSNSLVDTIEDQFGRVRHNVELQVNKRNKKFNLNTWRITKPILVLRTFLSNSLLLNHSVQDLSQTFDRQLPAADVTILVDVAVFSPGDLFTILFTVHPHQKHVRLECIEATVTESRRYAVSELGAWRTTSDTFPLRYLYATAVGDSCLTDGDISRTADMTPVFSRQAAGLDLTDTYAYRVTFATPSCKHNIHHTTHYDDILFRHRLDINVALSYIDDNAQQEQNQITPSVIDNTHSSSSSSPAGWQKMLYNLRKGKPSNDQRERRYEKITVSTPINVFDCRLKEDYGSLPSYFETGLVKPRFTTIMPPATATDGQYPDNHHAYLCDCYYEFCQQMESPSTSSSSLLSSSDGCATLTKVPSMPPPAYID